MVALSFENLSFKTSQSSINEISYESHRCLALLPNGFALHLCAQSRPGADLDKLTYSATVFLTDRADKGSESQNLYVSMAPASKDFLNLVCDYAQFLCGRNIGLPINPKQCTKKEINALLKSLSSLHPVPFNRDYTDQTYRVSTAQTTCCLTL